MGDLDAARLRLQEYRLQAARLQQSRDHFRERAEELCRQPPAAPHVAATAPPCPEGTPALTSGTDLMSVVAGSFGLAEALRKVQDDLAELAGRWEEQPPPSPL